MALLLSNTKDQTLLALVIQKAHEILKGSSGYVGRTALQKIVYFLKACGVPTEYQFSIHHYGPYCDRIVRDVDWLVADGVIVDRSQKPEKYSSFAPGNQINELLESPSNVFRQSETVITDVVRNLIRLEPNQMEELATLDYLYRRQSAQRPQPPEKNAVVDEFIRYKGDKFPRSEVERLYDLMFRKGRSTANS